MSDPRMSDSDMFLASLTPEMKDKFAPECPVCHARSLAMVFNSPYRSCDVCNLWFQSPLPPKRYEAPEEKGADGRSAGHEHPEHLLGSAQLARALYTNWISKVPKTGSHRAIDIGCKYPYLAYILNREFKVEAYGIDGMDQDTPDQAPIVSEYEKELGVPMMLMDFEAVTGDEIVEKAGGKFHSVSMVHVFEHMYDPKKALKRVHDMLVPGGVFFIRVPAHDVTGYEMHMSERHYPIHPFFYSDKSMRRLLDATDLFEIKQTYELGAGQRDFILQPK